MLHCISIWKEVDTVLDVVALGELLIDFTGTGLDTQGFPALTAHPGGAPANALAALAKFGARTALLGKVGDDLFGHLLHKALSQAGIGTQGLIFDNSVFTTLAFVTLDPSGECSFSFARKPGADTRLRFEELDLRLIEEARVFHFGTLSLTDEPARTATRQAVAFAKGRNKLITFDPNLRLPLWQDPEQAKAEALWGLSQADVVKISCDEVEFLFGLGPAEGAAHIRSHYGVKLMFVTCGGEGCWFENPLARGHVDAPSGIEIRDTTGAGDIFGGSALWKLLQTGKEPEQLTEPDLLDIARFACTAATLSARTPGGLSSVPDRGEVLRCLHSFAKGESK